jgi:hypothetical protein
MAPKNDYCRKSRRALETFLKFVRPTFSERKNRIF